MPSVKASTSHGSASRERAGSFMALCQTPELACEVTLQPLARFPLDAAILFSDILTIPDAMGLGLSFVEGEGPRFARPLRSAADIEALAVPDPAVELRYVIDAVSLIRRELAGKVPLIGFSGSPWTLACYMIEGGGGTDFRRAKALLAEQPELMHRLLDVLTRAVIDYLAAQRAAGAQALQVFDSWGGVLAPAHFREFSLRYLQRIADALPRHTRPTRPAASQAGIDEAKFKQCLSDQTLAAEIQRTGLRGYETFGVEGTPTTRRAGRTGTNGWTARLGMPQPPSD